MEHEGRWGSGREGRGTWEMELAGVGGGEALGRDDLEDVAGLDVVAGLFDDLEIALLCRVSM